MIVIVSGVSGAGKTTVGKLLAEELGWRFYEADDFHPHANIDKMRSGRPLTDEDRWPWLQRLREQITRSIAAKENAVLACSALKHAYRERLRVSADVKFVFLRGDYALVEKQLRRRRSHFMNPGLLRSQFADLEEPGPDEKTLTIELGNSARACIRNQNQIASDQERLKPSHKCSSHAPVGVRIFGARTAHSAVVAARADS